jgi:tetratricopeptide (TPR) repeat protein
LCDVQRALALIHRADQYGPRDVKTTFLLAQAQAAAREYDAAIAGFEAVLQAIPNQPDATLKLADVLLQLGRREEAVGRIKASLAALQSVDQPQAKVLRSRLLTRLGDIAAAQQDVAGAIEQYGQALAQWPENYQATNNLAWLLATTANPANRNGKRAVALAERARAMVAKAEPNVLETLAAAYAANAQFEQAVKTAQLAQSLAREANDRTTAEAIERQLKAYRSGQPFVSE